MVKNSVYSLHSAFCTQPAFYSQSAVCILPLVRSLQSAVCSLRITLTANRFSITAKECLLGQFSLELLLLLFTRSNIFVRCIKEVKLI